VDVQSVQSRVVTNGLAGQWSGAAAEAFRSSLDKLPDELDKVSTGFDDAAQSLSAFTAKLEGHQQQATWYAQQISNARSELEGAQARQAAAQTKLDAARVAHAAAADPLSLNTARSAMDLGASLLRQAVADVEAVTAEIERLFDAAAANHSDYLGAVAACCAALSFAYNAGSRSFGAWAGSHVGAIAGRAEHGLFGFWHRAEHDAAHLARGASETALKEMDQHWGQVRGALLRGSSAMSDLAMAAMVLATLLAIPAIGGLDAVQSEVTDGVVGAGDDIEAARGNATYQRDLPGDEVRLVTDVLPDGAAEAVHGVGDLETLPAIRDVTNRLLARGASLAESAAPVVDDRFEQIVSPALARPRALTISIPVLAGARP
jgi:uncharacterized protein YukE